MKIKYYIMINFLLLSCGSETNNIFTEPVVTDTTVIVLPCSKEQIFANTTTHESCTEVKENVRYIFSNGIPPHEYGPFGGIATLEAQENDFSSCAYPNGISSSVTELIEDPTSPGCSNGIVFGLTIKGIHYSPFARLYWVNPNTGEENKNFIEEADFVLNIDKNGGHVNSVNLYHYHNISKQYYADSLKIDSTKHSPIVGYAADGFPIYYKYLYSNTNDSSSSIKGYSSSYQLKSGNRTGDGVSAPNGAYDGRYVQDYEYVDTLSELGICGNHFAVTPEYPEGTHFYVLTDEWPFIPRCLVGNYVDPSFKIGRNCPPSDAETQCPIQ